MVSILRLACALLVLLGPFSRVAEATGPQALSVDAAREFRSVGRLNIAGRRFCTATLIGESLVLTAAHCLFDPRTRERMPLSSMHFVAGLNRGGYVAARRVARAALLPEYRYSGKVDDTSVGSDVALLELTEPIPASVALPEPTGAGDPGAPLAIVSYSRQRPHAPSREAGGALLWRAGRMLVIDFFVTHGASGAPVFAEQNGRRRLLGIVSASAKLRGRPVALSVMTGDAITRLLRKLRPLG